MELAGKTDKEIGNWIANHEAQGKTDAALYHELLEERARRAQARQGLDIERSLTCLRKAAIGQTCTTYGELAAASGVEWSRARHQMNGPNGHLDRLVDVCHARGMPLLTAICVNQGSIASGELESDALVGFIAAAKRLGLSVADARDFHHQTRDRCWEWGREQRGA